MRTNFHADADCSSHDNEVVIFRCVSASLVVVVNEWQSKNITDNIDKPTWEEMCEDWNAYLLERSTSLSV